MDIPASPRRSTRDDVLDALIAVRCQLGERPAFDDLIRRWAQPLRNHVLRVVGDPNVADDLVQDIWLGILQGIGRLQDPTRLRPWLFGIAHRRLMDRLRERYAAPVASADALEELVDDQPSPDFDLEARDLQAGIAALPAAEREALGLFHLQGLSLVEIAEALAVPVGTVKSRLFRARRQLRIHLNGESHE